MALRVCLVTPFTWSQRHEVNEHVAGAAEALRSRGHEVAILAPSNRSADLAEGRRKLRRAQEGEPLDGLVVLGPAIPVATRNRLSVPVAVRANLRLALARGAFDIVHVHEPAVPGISYLAAREASAITVATFHSNERLGYPPGTARRERLLARLDAVTAVASSTKDAVESRFPADVGLVAAGVDTVLFTPGPGRQRFVVEADGRSAPLVRAAVRALGALPGYELVVVRTAGATRRPDVPRSLRRRVSTTAAASPAARAEALRGATGFVAGADEGSRLALEAMASGVPLVAPPARLDQPELIGAAMERLATDPGFREREAAAARRASEAVSLERLGSDLDRLYGRLLGGRRRPPAAEPLADRPWIHADLHMHTEHSHDCTVPVAELLSHAESIGLGAIAVTDHNVFRGAAEAVDLARGRALTVIPGEEVKTADQGEVIGLFLREEIPRGMSMAETIAAIREQGGLVYLPHPFDRLHAIPDTRTLRRHLPEIDVIEVYNARLLFESYNDEAERLARRHNLLAGAGSDAHVLQGVGTGCLRMRAFRDPEEFLLSLRTAEVVRRPKSLLYLQSLKWIAQAREQRRVRAAAR